MEKGFVGEVEMWAGPWRTGVREAAMTGQESAVLAEGKAWL